MYKKININSFKMLVVLTGIFLSSCFEKKSPEEREKFYFDLKGFFENEAMILDKQKAAAEKHLISELDTQKLTIVSVNWEEELAPFINSDINKPAWEGSYQADSISDGEALKLISYKSLEKNLPVKEIQIHYNNNKVNHIFIENATDNYVYNSVQVLSYNANNGFSIEGEQDIILGRDLHYKVVVNFIKK